MWVFSSKLSLLFKITIWGALGSERAGKRLGSPSLPCGGLKSSCNSHSSTPRSFEVANGNHLSEVHTRESWLVRSTCKVITGNSSSGEISSDLTGPKGICQVSPQPVQPCERTRCPAGAEQLRRRLELQDEKSVPLGVLELPELPVWPGAPAAMRFDGPSFSIPRGRWAGRIVVRRVPRRGPKPAAPRGRPRSSHVALLHLAVTKVSVLSNGVCSRWFCVRFSNRPKIEIIRWDSRELISIKEFSLFCGLSVDSLGLR